MYGMPPRRSQAPRSRAGVLVLALVGTVVALFSSLPSVFVTSGPTFRRPSAAIATGRRGVAWPVARQQASQDSTKLDVKKGAKLQVEYEKAWYDCEILAVSADGTTCSAKYDEGGDEEEDIDIASRIREIPPPMPLTKGQKVEVWHEGVYYDCEIITVSEDGTTCTAKYDEGGDEEEDIDVRDRVREPRIPFSSLEQGQKFLGTVQSVAGFGAFVDIGAERDGLVHISKIANQRIDNIEDYVSVGQEVDVWVSEVRDDGKLALTMVESKIGGGGPRAPSDYSGFVDVSPDEWLTGTVASIAPFGIFVTVTPPGGGATADGLVHITAIRDGFVENTEDEAQVGQEVQVRVKSVDQGMGRMSLSMKADDGFGGGGGGGAPREEVDLAPFEQAASDSQWLKGKVARIAPFGLFVTVSLPDGPTADGLVHITQIRDGFVETCEDEAEVGQEVDVWIQSVDVVAGKMSLSMKQGGEGGEY